MYKNPIAVVCTSIHYLRFQDLYACAWVNVIISKTLYGYWQTETTRKRLNFHFTVQVKTKIPWKVPPFMIFKLMYDLPLGDKWMEAVMHVVECCCCCHQ